MMYSNKFVLALKSNGKVLRETKDVVHIPFGSEFSILLKNLNSKRAVVKVSIDGNDVLNGDELVVDANSELNLERFLESQFSGRKFKFIERTGEIEAHRGVGSEDGLVRVEVTYEAVRPYTPPPRRVKKWEYDPWCKGTDASPRWESQPSSIMCDANYDAWHAPRCSKSLSKSADMAREISCSAAAAPEPMGIAPTLGDVGYNTATSACLNNILAQNSFSVAAQNANDVGFTVEGSKSDQQFYNVDIGTLENESHVLVLHMKGYIDDKPVVQPVTVKTKKVCTSCGSTWPFNMEYCPKDGTFLKV